MAAERSSLRSTLVLIALQLASMVQVHGQSIAKRSVTIHAQRVSVARALDLVAREADRKLSYNAASVPADSIIDLHCEAMSVDQVLGRILPAHLQWKESGSHVIILTKPTGGQRAQITGKVVDLTTGAPLAAVSLYEVGRSKAALTGRDGTFTLDLRGDRRQSAVRCTRHGYADTVVYMVPTTTLIALRPDPASHARHIDPRCSWEHCTVEELGVSRLLVGTGTSEQSRNLDIAERRPWQVSLLPSLGTNGQLSGTVVNNMSFNVLGGYARGLEGVELAGGVNLLRNDMRGVQVAGIANILGGTSDGVQVAGASNHVMGMVKGFQIAGATNTAWDTLSGVQFSGGVNLVRRGMSGTQVSGGLNLTMGDMDGVQVSGGVNGSLGGVNKVQVAGALNYAYSVTGAQIAGGMNIALGPVGGGQVGFGANYASDVQGGQVSFGTNVAIDTVTGGQVGFASNYARVVEGGQITFGINLATHTVRGAQVGVVNFARRALGAQVGILNISDTVSGAAIGLLTIARTGYHRFDVVHTDVLPMSLHLRTGVRHFHNILGYSPAVEASGRWGFLYGFGSSPRVGKHGQLDITLTAEQVVEQRQWVDAVNLVARLGVAYGVLVADRFSLAAGPVLNSLVTDHRDADTGAFLSTLLPANNLLDQVDGNTRFGLWMGWNLALGVRF
jgi:hypothetical protein